MELTIYHVDAFTDKVFAGNQAGVCPLNNWLNDELLQNIAIGEPALKSADRLNCF